MTNSDRIQKLIELFFKILQLNPTIHDFVYNEFSLQHELGIFLRQQLGDNYQIQFERHIKHFYRNATTIKKEIDIVIFNKEEQYAIELKFPRNGQYPETMFSCLKDIAFMSSLKNLGFTATFCVCLVDDKNFYSGNKDGIYQYFRAPTQPLVGNVQKPTGAKNELLCFDQTYQVNWQTLNETHRFYIIQIGI